MRKITRPQIDFEPYVAWKKYHPADCCSRSAGRSVSCPSLRLAFPSRALVFQTISQTFQCRTYRVLTSVRNGYSKFNLVISGRAVSSVYHCANHVNVLLREKISSVWSFLAIQSHPVDSYFRRIVHVFMMDENDDENSTHLVTNIQSVIPKDRYCL